ncbi:MAG: metallophosphoesterase [Candidatus Dojkabacteria bacterium]|nr:metallophosphoesterase [Candidatus Dojkabacteria bacterium]
MPETLNTDKRVEIYLPEITSVLVVADLHLFVLPRLGVPSRLQFHNVTADKLQALEALYADVVVFNGDTFDTSIQTNINATLTRAVEVLERLRAMKEVGHFKRLIFISGNHDRLSVLEMLRNLIPELEIEIADRVVLGDNIVEIKHGDDIVQPPIGEDRAKELYERALKENPVRAALMAGVGRLISLFYGQIAYAGNIVIGGWVNKTRLIPRAWKARVITLDDEMITYAQKSGFQWSAFGHTHTPNIVSKYANPGSFGMGPGRKEFFAVRIDSESVTLVDIKTRRSYSSGESFRR